MDFFDGHGRDVGDEDPSDGVAEAGVDPDEVELQVEAFLLHDFHLETRLEVLDDLLPPATHLREFQYNYTTIYLQEFLHRKVFFMFPLDRRAAILY